MMSGAKHTPGPWLLGKDKDGCSVAEWQDETGVFWPVAWTYLDDSTEQGRANGHLIAAAPDLLAALRGLLHLFSEECYGMPKSYGGPAKCRAAKSAIAKARGEGPTS